MQNQPDCQSAFERAFIALCETADKSGMAKLKEILSQNKSPAQMLTDILVYFPNFKTIFDDELRKNI